MTLPEVVLGDHLGAGGDAVERLVLAASAALAWWPSRRTHRWRTAGRPSARRDIWVSPRLDGIRRRGGRSGCLHPDCHEQQQSGTSRYRTDSHDISLHSGPKRASQTLGVVHAGGLDNLATSGRPGVWQRRLDAGPRHRRRLGVRTDVCHPHQRAQHARPVGLVIEDEAPRGTPGRRARATGRCVEGSGGASHAGPCCRS